MGQWVADRMRFLDQPVPRDDLQSLWTALGVDSEWVGTLADLGLIWREGRLEASAAHVSNPELLDIVSGALLRLWGFTPFSDSRWVTVGRSCRTLTMGLLTGVVDLARTLLKHQAVSMHRLGGVNKLTSNATEFVTMAALGAYPSDAILTELLEDGRAVSRLGHLQGCLDDEIHWLAILPWPVGALLGSAVGEGEGAPPPPRELRSNTLAAAHTSAAFITICVSSR